MPHHHGPHPWRPRTGGRFLQPIVLLALLDGPTHGYELIRRASAPGSGPDAAGIYRTLRALERDGFVSSNWVPGESGPARRRYEITDGGRKLLDGWITHVQARRDSLDEMIATYESKTKRRE